MVQLRRVTFSSTSIVRSIAGAAAMGDELLPKVVVVTVCGSGLPGFLGSIHKMIQLCP